MSAYVVDYDHIDFLVSAGLNYRLTWIWDFDQDAGTYKRNELNKDTARAAGQMLWDENIKSVSHRYQDDLELPGPIDTDGVGIYSLNQNGLFDSIKPLQIIKACDCYDYQACEHPGWHTSEAKAFTEALRSAATTTTNHRGGREK